MSVKRIEGDRMEIWIKDLFGANLRRLKTKSSKGIGVCKGIELYTYAEREVNKLKHKTIYLSHPSEITCKKWLEIIHNRLKSECRLCMNSFTSVVFGAVLRIILWLCADFFYL